MMDLFWAASIDLKLTSQSQFYRSAVRLDTFLLGLAEFTIDCIIIMMMTLWSKESEALRSVASGQMIKKPRRSNKPYNTPGSQRWRWMGLMF